MAEDRKFLPGTEAIDRTIQEMSPEEVDPLESEFGNVPLEKRQKIATDNVVDKLMEKYPGFPRGVMKSHYEKQWDPAQGENKLERISNPQLNAMVRSASLKRIRDAIRERRKAGAPKQADIVYKPEPKNTTLNFRKADRSWFPVDGTLYETHPDFNPHAHEDVNKETQERTLNLEAHPYRFREGKNFYDFIDNPTSEDEKVREKIKSTDYGPLIKKWGLPSREELPGIAESEISSLLKDRVDPESDWNYSELKNLYRRLDKEGYDPEMVTRMLNEAKVPGRESLEDIRAAEKAKRESEEPGEMRNYNMNKRLVGKGYTDKKDNYYPVKFKDGRLYLEGLKQISGESGPYTIMFDPAKGIDENIESLFNLVAEDEARKEGLGLFGLNKE